MYEWMYGTSPGSINRMKECHEKKSNSSTSLSSYRLLMLCEARLVSRLPAAVTTIYHMFVWMKMMILEAVEGAVKRSRWMVGMNEREVEQRSG